MFHWPDFRVTATVRGRRDQYAGFQACSVFRFHNDQSGNWIAGGIVADAQTQSKFDMIAFQTRLLLNHQYCHVQCKFSFQL